MRTVTWTCPVTGEAMKQYREYAGTGETLECIFSRHYAEWPVGLIFHMEYHNDGDLHRYRTGNTPGACYLAPLPIRRCAPVKPYMRVVAYSAITKTWSVSLGNVDALIDDLERCKQYWKDLEEYNQ